MDWVRQCAAVIPCLNEAEAIHRIVIAVRRVLPTVIVVDDGSTDATMERAAAAGAVVLRHAHNRGKGAALRTGLRLARERGFVWVLAMDGDGQHSPDDIPMFFARAAQTGALLVVGDRMGRASAIPWLRRLVNRWMTRRIARLVGIPLADSQCGFRLLNLEAAARLQLTRDRFEVESEQLVAFLAAGYRVDFVPVQVIYESPSSKIHPFADAVRWFRWWFAHRGKQRFDVSSRADSGVRRYDLIRGDRVSDKPDSLRLGKGHARQNYSACADRRPKNMLLKRLYMSTTQTSRWSPSRLWHGLKKTLLFLLVVLSFGSFYNWVSPRAFPREQTLGFGYGMLHGGLMPMALPSLVMGDNVEIFAANNSGRPYKLGYIIGINVCGLIFFGSAFWKPRRSHFRDEVETSIVNTLP